MPSFTWSGKDSAGKKFSRYIEAPTAHDARIQLEEQGCTGLQMHSDEYSSVIRESFASPIELSAEERLRLRKRGKNTIRRAAWKIIKTHLGWYSFFAILFVLSACTRYLAGLVYSAVAMVGVFLFRFCFSLPGLFHTAIVDAKEWHRWNDVLKSCRRLERMSGWTNVKIPSHVIANYRAQAICGLGDLPAALKEYSRFEYDTRVPRWFFLTHLAGIHDLAKDYERSVELTRQAIDLLPTNVALQMGLVSRLIKTRDFKAARVALERADTLQPTDLSPPFLLLNKGIVELEESRYPEAQGFLEQALKGLQQRSQLALIPGSIRVTKAYLCLLYAKLGKASEAKRLLEEVRTYLLAIDEAALLQRCEEALHTNTSLPTTSAGKSAQQLAP